MRPHLLVTIRMGFILSYRMTEVGMGFETLHAAIFAVGLCQAQHTCVANLEARLNVGNFQGDGKELRVEYTQTQLY